MRIIQAALRSSALRAFLFVCVWPQSVPFTAAFETTQAVTTRITREDLFVPHVSTVPANAGQTVRIAVRRVTPKDQQPTRGAVLFTTSGFTSSVTMFDLDYKTQQDRPPSRRTGLRRLSNGSDGILAAHLAPRWTTRAMWIPRSRNC